MAIVSAEDAQNWLIEKIAHRLDVDRSEITPDQYFDELDLDSTRSPDPRR